MKSQRALHQMRLRWGTFPVSPMAFGHLAHFKRTHPRAPIKSRRRAIHTDSLHAAAAQARGHVFAAEGAGGASLPFDPPGSVGSDPSLPKDTLFPLCVGADAEVSQRWAHASTAS